MSADRPTGGGQGLTVSHPGQCCPGSCVEDIDLHNVDPATASVAARGVERILAARADKDAAVVAVTDLMVTAAYDEYRASDLDGRALIRAMLRAALAALDVATPTADLAYPEPENGTAADLTTPLFEQSAEIDFEPTADPCPHRTRGVCGFCIPVGGDEPTADPDTVRREASERIAQAIERVPTPYWLNSTMNEAWRQGMADAASIARADAVAQPDGYYHPPSIPVSNEPQPVDADGTGGG